MQFEFRFGACGKGFPEDVFLRVGAAHLPVRFVRHRRARRYVLRLAPDGAARVTVPRGGTVAEGMRFAERNTPWLERQLLKRAARPAYPERWIHRTQILFRGELFLWNWT